MNTRNIALAAMSALVASITTWFVSPDGAESQDKDSMTLKTLTAQSIYLVNEKGTIHVGSRRACDRTVRK